MRIRNLLILMLLLLIAVVIALAKLWSIKPSANPTISLTLLSYTNVSNPQQSFFPGSWLVATIGIKNIGKTGIQYGVSPLTENPGPVAEVETPLGLSTNCYWGMTPYNEALRPGESDTFPIMLPTNTIRWKFSFVIFPANNRDQILYSKHTSTWLNPGCFISALSLRLFPKEDELPVKLQSKVIEMGTNAVGLPCN